MAKYVVKRVIMALVPILVVACVTFLLMMSVPGSPFNDEKITEQQRAQMDAKYGLDKPLVIQMANYMKGALKGDLGVSLKMQKDRPVLKSFGKIPPVCQDRRCGSDLGRAGGRAAGLSGGL